MHSKSPRSLSRLSAFTATASVALLLTSSAFAQTTGFNKGTAGPFIYTDTANWVNATINGIWDASLTLTAGQSIQFTSDAILTTGLDLEYTGGNNITFTGSGGARTLSLGGDITVNPTGNATINFGSTSAAANLNVDLGGAVRAFNVSSSRTLGFVNVLSNGGVIVNGGTVNFSGTNTYSGTTTVNTGALSLNGATGSSANSDITVNGAPASVSLTFNSGTNGNTGIVRAKSVTLVGSGSSGASLLVNGNSTTNSNDSITNALTAGSGYSIVAISPNAAKNAQLTAGSYVRELGGTTLFRGAGLGVNTIASLTAGATNIVLNDTTGLLVGSGSAGTSTVGIIAGAYGDSTAGGSGFTASTSGLVTYDAAKGVRVLAANEYSAAVVDGQSTADNVRYVNASTGTAVTTTLTNALTTVNSLSFSVTGTGTNTGVNITGDATTTLRINSGMVYANINVTTAAATDAVTVTVGNLDFNGKEAIFVSSTSGGTNFTAPLYINGTITNTTGLTKVGGGAVFLGGSVANSYTGVTTVNGGQLMMAKTADGVNAINGDVIINGGTLQYYTKNEQIADSANVTVKGGSFSLQYSNFGNSFTETINNLTLSGGTFSGGSAGKSGRLSVNDLNVVNTVSSVYTPISISGGSTAANANRIALRNNFNFTGNSTNTNTATISGGAGQTFRGIIALNGNRTFNIGNGAAAVDVTITTMLTDDGATVGGLNKTGLGSLLLAGANTYTGATTVTQGVLSLGVANALAATSPVILAGGTLDTGGFAQSLATLSLTANSTIDLGAAVSLTAVSFADSSASIWTSSISLSFVNFTAGVDTIRFGTSNTGLTTQQLSQITINGLAATIDANGYLGSSAIPEPSTYAAIAGVSMLALAIGYRRRQRNTVKAA